MFAGRTWHLWCVLSLQYVCGCFAARRLSKPCSCWWVLSSCMSTLKTTTRFMTSTGMKIRLQPSWSLGRGSLWRYERTYTHISSTLEYIHFTEKLDRSRVFYCCHWEEIERTRKMRRHFLVPMEACLAMVYTHIHTHIRCMGLTLCLNSISLQLPCKANRRADQGS